MQYVKLIGICQGSFSNASAPMCAMMLREYNMERLLGYRLRVAESGRKFKFGCYKNSCERIKHDRHVAYKTGENRQTWASPECPVPRYSELAWHMALVFPIVAASCPWCWILEAGARAPVGKSAGEVVGEDKVLVMKSEWRRGLRCIFHTWWHKCLLGRVRQDCRMHAGPKGEVARSWDG